MCVRYPDVGLEFKGVLSIVKPRALSQRKEEQFREEKPVGEGGRPTVGSQSPMRKGFWEEGGELVKPSRHLAQKR